MSLCHTKTMLRLVLRSRLTTNLTNAAELFLNDPEGNFIDKLKKSKVMMIEIGFLIMAINSLRLMWLIWHDNTNVVTERHNKNPSQR